MARQQDLQSQIEDLLGVIEEAKDLLESVLDGADESLQDDEGDVRTKRLNAEKQSRRGYGRPSTARP